MIDLFGGPSICGGQHGPYKMGVEGRRYCIYCGVYE